MRTNMPASTGAVKKQELADGFPAQMSGPLVFCHQDNLNTDGVRAHTRMPLSQAFTNIQNSFYTRFFNVQMAI